MGVVKQAREPARALPDVFEGQSLVTVDEQRQVAACVPIQLAQGRRRVDEYPAGTSAAVLLGEFVGLTSAGQLGQRLRAGHGHGCSP